MQPRVALVETDAALPGLLPFQSWDVLGTAPVVLLRDPATHPWTAHLHLAGLDLEAVEPARLERDDLDLQRPGAPDDRRIAKALVQRAVSGQEVVYLLHPDERGLAPALAGMAAQHDVEIELVFLAQQPPGTQLLRLVAILRQLRDQVDGCPWDLEQDHRTLVRYLVEEVYELIDAIETGDDEHVQEELGDVLLQVVFHAQVAADRGAFAIDDVAGGIADKLVHRHPHVFAEGDASTAAEVESRWDELKDQEKGPRGPFDGVPAAGPGLELLATLQRKAAKHDIEVAASAAPGATIEAILQRLATPGSDETREGLFGELLEGVVALARHLDVDPEAAARRAAREFRTRATR